MRYLASVAVFACVAWPALGQGAQPMEFKDLLYGSTTPLALKLKDMNSDWRRMQLGGAGDTTGMAALGSLFGGAAEPVYYTRGQAVNVAGETYIVAYKANLQQPSFMDLIMQGAASGGKEPDMSKLMPEKLTPDTPLSLCLLNLKTSGNLTDIRPFDMQQEIAESGKMSGGLMNLMMLGMMSDKNKASMAPVKAVKTPTKSHK